MAFPTVSKTYGLKPINRLDGLPYAGAIRQIPIAAAYATAILNGDTVAVDTNGYLIANTTSNSGDSVGVLVGCSYTNSSGQPVQGQFYPALHQHQQLWLLVMLWMILMQCSRLWPAAVKPQCLRLLAARWLVQTLLCLSTLVALSLVIRTMVLTVLPPVLQLPFPSVWLTLCPILQLALPMQPPRLTTNFWSSSTCTNTLTPLVFKE